MFLSCSTEQSRAFKPTELYLKPERRARRFQKYQICQTESRHRDAIYMQWLIKYSDHFHPPPFKNDQVRAVDFKFFVKQRKLKTDWNPSVWAVWYHQRVIPNNLETTYRKYKGRTGVNGFKGCRHTVKFETIDTIADSNTAQTSFNSQQSLVRAWRLLLLDPCGLFLTLQKKKKEKRKKNSPHYPPPCKKETF